MNADCSICEGDEDQDQDGDVEPDHDGDGDQNIKPFPPQYKSSEGQYVPVTKHENPYEDILADMTEEQLKKLLGTDQDGGRAEKNGGRAEKNGGF